MGKLIDRVRSSQLFNDSFWVLFGGGLGKGLSLISGIFIARFLGKESFGEYGTMKNTLVFIAIVSTFGFGYTATKFIIQYIQNNSSKVRQLISALYKITIAISLFLAMLQFLFAEQLSIFLENANLRQMLQIFSPLILLNAIVTIQIAIMSGLKIFKQNAIVNTYSGIICFIASIILTYQFGLYGALAALGISYITQLLLSHYYIRININKFPQSEFHIAINEILSMFKFSTPIALQESLYVVVHWMSLYILIRFSNYGEVGISSAAGTWLALIIAIPAMLKNVMFSHLSSSSNHKTLVNRLLLINLVATLIPAIMVSVSSNWIVSFYGNAFKGLHDVLIVCVISSIFICLSEVYCYEFISIAKPWTVFVCRLIRDGLILISTYLVIRNLDSNHAYIQSCISLIGNILFFVFLHIMYKITLKNA